MSDESRERGRRLRDFVLSNYTGKRGVSGLADASGIQRQTLHEWFRGKGEPSLTSVAALAATVSVTRAEIVAAIDGQIPPPTLRSELRAVLSEAPRLSPDDVALVAEASAARALEAVAARAVAEAPGARDPAATPPLLEHYQLQSDAQARQRGR